MGAKMHGNRSGPKADNDNNRWKPNEKGEIPIPNDERRTAPVIERLAGMGWYCLVTIPQAEYHCADGLSTAGIASYVPTETYWEARRKGKESYPTELQRPLLRGYVFAHLPRPKVREDGLGVYCEFGDAWNPIFARDVWDESKLKILRILGANGCPVAMPLSFRNEDGELCGIQPLAVEERQGWFDSRKRSFLVAEKRRRDAAEAAAKRRAKDDAAAARRRAEDAAKRDSKPVWINDEVRPRKGPFAGMAFKAENDNDDRGHVRLSRTLFGQTTIVSMPVKDLENLTRPEATGEVALRRA